MQNLLLIWLVACSGGKESADSSTAVDSVQTGDSSDSQDTSTDTGEREGNPTVGAELFKSSCSTCHGADGKLGKPVNEVPAADLTVLVPSLTDQELMDVMQKGYGQMPAQLVDEKPAFNCLAYLRQTFL